jgi:hypothetical protein
MALGSPAASSSSFFGSLKQRALDSLAAHRAESAREAAQKAAGLLRVTRRCWILSPRPAPPSTGVATSASASMAAAAGAAAEDVKQMQASVVFLSVAS